MYILSSLEQTVDPEKKDYFYVNPKKELICWDGIFKVNQRLNFLNNIIPGTFCWQGPLPCSVHREKPDWTRFLHYALLIYIIWVNHCRETLVSSVFLPMDWDLLNPIRTTQYGYLIYLKQTWLGPDWELLL